ncbi:hypothetical protein ASwh1_123 [Aeromonas phage Aswh_1]|nr:hypothetical protein ASwh1_123 [Aeromonas phage Aswh_1]
MDKVNASYIAKEILTKSNQEITKTVNTIYECITDGMVRNRKTSTTFTTNYVNDFINEISKCPESIQDSVYTSIFGKFEQNGFDVDFKKSSEDPDKKSVYTITIPVKIIVELSKNELTNSDLV